MDLMKCKISQSRPHEWRREVALAQPPDSNQHLVVFARHMADKSGGEEYVLDRGNVRILLDDGVYSY